ncbi:MAG: TetR family transcriptional regulator [Solirubrobacterales bacterium]|nr:TetR family transcriptional regulator [Solirubrobacterales bacterium]
MPPGGAEATREKLLAATHELLLERHAASASIADICSRAEVNVAMVKYCFDNKDGLLDALLERALQQLAGQLERLAALDADPKEKLRRHVSEIVRNYVRFPYVNRLMNERLMQADPESVARIGASFATPARAFYAQLLADGEASGMWRPLDPTLFFFSVVGVCEFLFAARPLLEQGFGQELDAALVERYSAHAAELVLGGMSAR